MEYITSASMNILWNGEVIYEFFPGRGIRQGNPLSPYIFILYIERLSHGITQTVEDGNWKPIRLAKHGTCLTHLFLHMTCSYLQKLRFIKLILLMQLWRIIVGVMKQRSINRKPKSFFEEYFI